MAETQTTGTETPATTNTDTSGSVDQQVVKGGGDNFTSFDELESVESSQIRQKELEVKQTVDAIEKVKGDKKDAKTTSKKATEQQTPIHPVL